MGDLTLGSRSKACLLWQVNGNIKWILFDLLGESLIENPTCYWWPPAVAPLMEVEEMSAAVILVHQLVDGQHIAIQ